MLDLKRCGAVTSVTEWRKGTDQSGVSAEAALGGENCLRFSFSVLVLVWILVCLRKECGERRNRFCGLPDSQAVEETVLIHYNAAHLASLFGQMAPPCYGCLRSETAPVMSATIHRITRSTVSRMHPPWGRIVRPWHTSSTVPRSSLTCLPSLYCPVIRTLRKQITNG